MYRSRLVRRFGVLAVALVALVAAVGLVPVIAQEAQPTQMPPLVPPGEFPQNTITVTGVGSAAGEPDTAYIELGVEIMNEDLAAAYAEASETLQNVIDALVELGIDRANIRTASVNVFPQDQYDPQTGQPGARTYRVSSTLRVKVTDVSMVEQVINTAVNAGANTIYSFNLALEDRDALEEQARQLAVTNAREHAEQLAAALGVSVGRPIVVSEVTGGGIPPIPYGAGGGGVVRMDVAESLPVAPGQLDVTAQVLVTYALEQ